MIAAAVVKTLKQSLYLLNVAISSYSWYIALNAEREIKKAEKIIAQYQLSRMMSKSTGGSDKTPLVEKSSDAFNAYLVGATSYSAQDASIRAHQIQSKRADKDTQACIVIQMFINILVSIVVGAYWKIPLSVVVAALHLVVPVSMRGMILHVGAMVQAPNILAWSVEVAFALVIYVKVVPGSLRWLTGMAYIAASSLIAFA